MIVLTPEQMRATDKQVIEDGIPDILLMENAGRGVAEAAADMVEAPATVLILAGKGNNGGDGLVAARFLDMWGYQPFVIGPAKEELNGNPLTNYEICENRSMNINNLSKTGDSQLISEIQKADLIIDAILGTGITGEVREPAARVIDFINQSQTPVLAVDIPSGISGETGEVLGKAVKADLTATMAFPKVGLVIYPGKSYTGDLRVIDLGMPWNSVQKIDFNHYLLTREEARNLLPPRHATAHKGTFGKLAVIGGSRGMDGAPVLSGYSALKTGAGLVELIFPESLQEIIAGQVPELISKSLPFAAGDFSVEEVFAEIEKEFKELEVAALGPGLGRSRDLTRLVEKIVRETEIPLILDADGLNAVSGISSIFEERKAPIILTPHPGEFSRLTGSEIEEIQEHRIEYARKFAVNNGVYLILKGAVTVVALPQGEIYLNQTGNQGMATAGSGDVLTGIISGLIAQGLNCERAVVLAPYIHGLAGDTAASQLTGYSVTAGNILNYIPRALEKILDLNRERK